MALIFKAPAVKPKTLDYSGQSDLPMENRVLRFRVVSASFSCFERFVFDLGSFVFDLLGVSCLVPRFQELRFRYNPFSCD